MYKILVDYQTGDSFGSEEIFGEPLKWSDARVDCEWALLDTAKTNLQRIKEHYEWVNKYDPCSYNMRFGDSLTDSEHAQLKRLKTHGQSSDYLLSIFIKRRPKFVELYKNGDTFNLQYYIDLLCDDGKTKKACCVWQGYFETLRKVYIVSSENDGWSFEV